jgi:biotin/methionine sulfoxide reductase
MSGNVTSSHWGLGVAESIDGKLAAVHPHPNDPNSSKINDNIASSLNGDARVLKPAVRRSWLESGAGANPTSRGTDDFIEVDWDTALDLIAAELNRVRSQYSNEAIFAGSYGWSSAGRFHHAQSQLKRFLNTIGGFVRSEGNYSYNAALVLMPHIVGNYRTHVAQATRFSVVAKHTELMVMFGGLAERNMQVSDGGVSKHLSRENLEACAKAGVKFVNISPLRTDAMQSLNARWLPPNPGTDTAIMLALAHTLIKEDLHDQSFLDNYAVGFDQVSDYVLGRVDGVVKDATWAAALSGLEVNTIEQLARDMANNRTLVCTAAGVQRADYGEQPLWMTVTLAAMLGQIGLPGGGYTIGYGVNGNIGNTERFFRAAALPQGDNPIEQFIPVAMLTEMLLKPGEAYRYNGEQRIFPDIKLVWWAGGNPFHHHQDLNRLCKAFQMPDTIIVNEINWTATARHADIVLPVTSPLERSDFGAGKSDSALVPMPAHATPAGLAQDEYDIYRALAKRMGTDDLFSEGRSTDQWLQYLWHETQTDARGVGIELADWESFLLGDVVPLPDLSPEQVFLADYRKDPIGNALPTPSGKLELYSSTIASFNLDDCLGHASWFVPRDIAQGKQRRYPLYLLSGQPKTRLHSQYDNGIYSKSYKIKDREPVLIHPDDAHSRGVADGDVVELYNDRGRCLAGARVTDEINRGCVFLWTGAWYDPDRSTKDALDRHGNPNVLTHDERTSSLSQSPAAHSTLVELTVYKDEPPEITVHSPPQFGLVG